MERIQVQDIKRAHTDLTDGEHVEKLDLKARTNGCALLSFLILPSLTCVLFAYASYILLIFIVVFLGGADYICTVYTPHTNTVWGKKFMYFFCMETYRNPCKKST